MDLGVAEVKSNELAVGGPRKVGSLQILNELPSIKATLNHAKGTTTSPFPLDEVCLHFGWRVCKV
jgi:hypothetical protein